MNSPTNRWTEGSGLRKRRLTRGLLGAVRAARSDPMARRARRVIWLLILIWVVGIYDLTFTLLGMRIGRFRELNPIARMLLDDPTALIAFKLLLMLLASLIILKYRRRLVTEIACWFLGATYVIVALAWMVYYKPS